MVELDIATCRSRERDIAADWVKHRDKINQELDKIGMSEAEWCRRELGCSIQTMRRRVQLLRGWSQYLKRRREVGNNGQFGLLRCAPGFSCRSGGICNERSADELSVPTSDRPIISPLQVHHRRCTTRASQDA